MKRILIAVVLAATTACSDSVGPKQICETASFSQPAPAHVTLYMGNEMATSIYDTLTVDSAVMANLSNAEAYAPALGAWTASGGKIAVALPYYARIFNHDIPTNVIPIIFGVYAGKQMGTDTLFIKSIALPRCENGATEKVVVTVLPSNSMSPNQSAWGNWKTDGDSLVLIRFR